MQRASRLTIKGWMAPLCFISRLHGLSLSCSPDMSASGWKWVRIGYSCFSPQSIVPRLPGARNAKKINATLCSPPILVLESNGMFLQYLDVFEVSQKFVEDLCFVRHELLVKSY